MLTSAAAIISTPPLSWCARDRTTAEIAAVWPKAQDFGFANEEAAFALQYGHGYRPRHLGEASDQPAWFHSSTRSRSSPEWCSRWKLSGPRLTAGALRALKKKS